VKRHSPIAATATLAEPAQASFDSDAAAKPVSPGEAEKQLFQCDPWVEKWEKLMWDDSGLVNLQNAAAIVGKYMPGPFGTADSKSLEFWGKHVVRLGYFISNAVAGGSGFALFGKNKDILDGFNGDNIGYAVKAASGLVLEAIMTYEQDWQRIKEGKFAMPWDMAAGNRQTTLPYALSQTARFVEEAIGTLERRSRRAPEDRKIWLESDNGMYPEYYQTNYHYQTDGWMSAKSAAVYETSTETLFLGKQDAMQRTSLIPLQGLKGVDGRPAKILEIACGTGRFATFIRDNHPTADLTCVDLSPFYLEAARQNDEYWRNFRNRGSSGEPYAPAQFVQAAAEALPFEAEGFDAVVCVYLFHEMPEGPRAAAAAEMARVLRPGGTLVLTDSVQRGDRPQLSDNVDEFERLNEPHVANYFETHLADLYLPHGLECGQKWTTSVSKTLSFTKPADLTRDESSSGDKDIEIG
jgi:ubiquinone/menaquinone biosynthesis C-methylase UbiE